MISQVNLSGPDRVVLRDVNLDMTGKYKCEVTSDAPDFETKSDVTQLHVIGKSDFLLKYFLNLVLSPYYNEFL